MNPELPNINALEAELEKAVKDKYLETMQKLLPEYRELVLKDHTVNTIESFSLSEQLERFTSFYQEHDIPTPDDFEAHITEIWNRNAEDIKEAIKEGEYDEILFIPPYDTKELNDKTTADYTNAQGEKTQTWQGSNFTEGGSFEGLHDTRTGIRIVLTHKAENLDTPELLATKNRSIYDLCNATTDAEKAQIDNLINTKQPLPLEGLTLGEYLIADRIHFKETGQHLDYSSSWTWLPASYSGQRVAHSSWRPGASQVHVLADVADARFGILGMRPSRVFK
jgi:hypothetical protein